MCWPCPDGVHIPPPYDGVPQPKDGFRESSFTHFVWFFQYHKVERKGKTVIVDHAKMCLMIQSEHDALFTSEDNLFSVRYSIILTTWRRCEIPYPGGCGWWLGCPRNNQIFFSVRTKTNRNSICFGCFSVCFAKPKNIFFGLFRCFGSVLNNRNKHNFVETNQKISKKRFILVGPRNN